jgi:VCBS repeat-containing protein
LTATSKVDNYLNISYVVNNANGKTVDLGTVSARSGQKVTLPVGKNIAPDGTYHGVTITINGVNSI